MAEPGLVPVGLEQQIHHAFHLRLDSSPGADGWRWDEQSGGAVAEHRFAFRWVSLENASGLLWPAQAMWINAVRQSLLHL